MTVTHETLAPSPSGLPWVSLHGIRTVAGHEFRVRLRAGRWRWLLAFWFLVLTGFTALLRWAIERADPEAPDPGVPMFGGLMLLLLGLVVAVLLGVVCALAQCLSALLARTMTSAVLSYLTVFALTVGTLIVFGLSLAATTETRTVTERVPAYDLTTGEPIPGQTRLETFTYTEVRPERVWWLLAPNPFVILADAAPQAEPRIDPRTGEELPRPFDPLGEIGRAVREARDPYRPGDIAAVDIAPTSPPYRPGPVWPYGLAFHLVLGVGAVALTVRRLRTPTRNLPRGVRVA
jgi:hypothetical protein